MASSEMMQFTNVMAHFFAIKTWQQLRSTMISSDLALALWLCFFLYFWLLGLSISWENLTQIKIPTRDKKHLPCTLSLYVLQQAKSTQARRILLYRAIYVLSSICACVYTLFALWHKLKTFFYCEGMLSSGNKSYPFANFHINIPSIFN